MLAVPAIKCIPIPNCVNTTNAIDFAWISKFFVDFNKMEFHCLMGSRAQSVDEQRESVGTLAVHWRALGEHDHALIHL